MPGSIRKERSSIKHSGIAFTGKPHQIGNSDIRLGDAYIHEARMDANETPFDASATSQSEVWPALAGQCAYITTAMNWALEELRQVRESDARLYEDLNMHPSEMMDARQLLVIASEHLKRACPPADALVLFEMSHQQLSKDTVQGYFHYRCCVV